MLKVILNWRTVNTTTIGLYIYKSNDNLSKEITNVTYCYMGLICIVEIFCFASSH